VAIIDVVKWNAPADELAWKYPSEELSTWTQLIVGESQEAVLVSGGQMEGPFAAGRHTLATENLPVLSKFLRLPFGRSPFTAEVWYVNRTVPLDIAWNINVPIQVEDPRYGVMLPIIASGQYGATVSHTRKFLKKFVGTLPGFHRSQLQDYLRGILITRVKSLLAKEIVKNKISILEISAHLNELSDALQQQIVPELSDYGIEITAFFVNTITAPEDDSAVQQMKQALANRATRAIEGYSYQQERSFDALETAAGNEGEAGSLMGLGIGAGLGLGAGAAMGGMMSQAAGQMSIASPPSVAPPQSGVTTDDKLKLLRELAALHKEGALTAEEFAAEKARLLK